MPPKNIKFSILFLIAMEFTTGNATAQSKTNPFYTETKAQYEAFHGHYDYVMFGDSLTQRGHWQDMFPNISIGNRGIGSDDTTGMLERLDSIRATKAKTVPIMAGTNDVSRKYPPDVIAKNILTIGKKLSETGIRIIVQSVILADKERRNKNIEINKINRILETESAPLGFQYIDVNKHLAPDGFLLEKYTVDGIHLTVQGYEIWRNILSPYLK